MYTPPQKSGQDFAPSQVESATMRRFIDKYPEIPGNAFARKLECAENYEGLIRTLPGLCTWGCRARTPAARLFKQSPCWLDEKSNARTTQYER
jgi:hypothetical protein